jgi:hypothetical protein
LSSKYLGNITLEDTRWFRFNTHKADGTPITLAGTPQIEIQEEDTDAAILTISVGTDFVLDANGTGSHKVKIACTAANGFEAGKSYTASIEGTTPTVDSISVLGTQVAHFNCQFEYDLGIGTPTDLGSGADISSNAVDIFNKVGQLAIGSGGVSVVANSVTITTGTPTNGVTDTESLDGTYHQIAAAASVTDFYYEFDIGVNGLVTELLWDGYVQSNNDIAVVYGYDWVAAGWVQVGTIDGTAGTTDQEKAFIFTNNMTGTGANAGKVRIRFESSGGAATTVIATDRVLAEYTVLASELFVLHSGIAQAGSSNTVTLDAGASAIDDFYNHTKMIIKSGTGVEQERIIVDYNGTTKVATVAPPWNTVPDTTSAFDIEPGLAHAETGWATIKVGLAVIGTATATEIELDANASSVDDYYNNDLVYIDNGTGEGQVRVITDYNGTTKIATVHAAWVTALDATSEYVVQEGHPYTDIATSTVPGLAWDEALASHNTAGTTGKALKQLKEGIISIEDSVNDGAPTATSFITTLPNVSDDAKYVDNYWIDKTLVFITGKNIGIGRVISAYTESTRTVTFDEAFPNTPDNADEFIILTPHIHTKSQISASVWDEATAGHNAAGSFGKSVNDIKISTDPMTYTIANKLDVNIKAIDDSTAEATRMKQALQGTIHGKVNTIPSGVNTLLVKSLTNDTLADLNQTDLLKNRVIIFTTGVAQGQAVGITAQAAAASDPITLTTTTMVNFANIAVDDEFVIV